MRTGYAFGHHFAQKDAEEAVEVVGENLRVCDVAGEEDRDDADQALGGSVGPQVVFFLRSDEVRRVDCVGHVDEVVWEVVFELVGEV